MIVENRSLSLDGSPLDSEVDIYTGVTAEDIVRAMKGATMFGARLSVDEYIDHIQRAAWEHAGVDLRVKGSTTAERAASLLSGLLENKLARVLGDEPPAKKGNHLRHTWQNASPAGRSGVQPGWVEFFSCVSPPHNLRPPRRLGWTAWECEATSFMNNAGVCVPQIFLLRQRRLHQPSLKLRLAGRGFSEGCPP